MVERRTPMPASAEAVYAWHERPGAFERLAPPWEHVELLERSGGLGDGSRTALRVRLAPLVHRRWVAVHREHVAGRQFVDEQVEGPFSMWRHLHRFEPRPDGTCDMLDRVEYTPPFGLLGAIADHWTIRRQVEAMLRYRHATLAADLAAHALFPGRSLHVLVSGASGLVGRALCAFLTSGGHRVRRLVRRPARGAHEAAWDPARGTIDAAAFDGIDAVVHLAGENVAAGRWSAAQRARIRDSRTQGTALLAQAAARAAVRPAVFVSASANGIYGDRGDEPLTEAAAPGHGFLADVATAWEGALQPAHEAGIRTVVLRFGVVLSPQGGALQRLWPLFRLGLGGRVGSGRQWMSWLSVDDAVGMIHAALLRETMRGAYNAVAPEPVTNAAFTRALADAVHRPALFPVPAFLLRLVFGEMAQATLLASSRTVPARLEAEGFRFRHRTLREALAHLLP